jgi:hypothetical protein
VPNDSEACWELFEGAWIVLIAGSREPGHPARPGGALHTLILPEIDGFLAAARERGVETGPVEPVGEGMRQSLVVDPDGNRLKVAAPVADG